MTETIAPMLERIDQQQLAQDLVAKARAEGVDLVGPGGPVEIEVPRDRDGSFEPAIVRKRQRRPDGIDAIVLSLTDPAHQLPLTTAQPVGIPRSLAA